MASDALSGAYATWKAGAPVAAPSMKEAGGRMAVNLASMLGITPEVTGAYRAAGGDVMNPAFRTAQLKGMMGAIPLAGMTVVKNGNIPSMSKDVLKDYGIDTPEFRKIIDDLRGTLPAYGADASSEFAWLDAIKAHPGYSAANSARKSVALAGRGRGGAASLLEALEKDGYSVHSEISKSIGSKSTYLYVSSGSKKVRVRLSDHALSDAASKTYGFPDVDTTPQHWRSAYKAISEKFGDVGPLKAK